MNNTPIQYQKGYCEFYKLKFKVTPDVLIPRPETELLVEEVIRFANCNQESSTSNKPSAISVLDIGTGSGNIAISIAKNLENIHILATDLSEKALKIAKQNAKFHQVEDKITFLVSDLLKNVKPSINPDVIVTNLPYIPAYRLPYLDKSVTDYEPNIALDGGSDGFDLYRKLFLQMLDKKLTPKLLIGEIDYTQAEIAEQEVLKYFPKAQVEIKFDLAHKQRILFVNF